MRRFCLRVCDGPSCGVTHESERLVALLEREIAASDDLRARVCVVAYTCFGRCDDGPNMFVQELAPGDDPHDEPDVAVFETARGFYPGMDEDKIVRVLREHCGGGDVVEDLVDSY
jgi:(2Fe-2S) ferredoxin